MSEGFGLGAVPYAGESPKEKMTCAFCERSSTVSPKFIRIDADRRVGDIPLVLTNVIHKESHVVCLQHWLENKQRYEVSAATQQKPNTSSAFNMFTALLLLTEALWPRLV